MKIEKLGKIGIGVGIAVGGMLIFMLALSIPNMIERYIQDYDVSRFEEHSTVESINADFLMDIFSQTEDYSVFVSRYPDHVEDLELYNDGGALRLTAFNTTSNNTLELYLRWDEDRTGNIDKDAYCRIGNSLDRGEITARESAVADFLKKTDCLE